MMKSLRAFQNIVDSRLEAIKIRVHHRGQIAVHDSRGGTFVFAVLWINRVRLTYSDAGQSASDDRGGAAFVLGIEEREEEADRQRFDAMPGEGVTCLLDRCVIERSDYLSMRPDALARLEAEMSWH